MRFLALVALRDPCGTRWILAENWQRLLGNDPDAGLGGEGSLGVSESR
jgi:hypothetical protein